MQPSEYELRLKDVEVSIDRLRSLYEQYFRGIEKQPPTVLQKRVEREMRELRKVRHRNTAMRFRVQMQVQKYTSYLTYWQRIMRSLELGQLKRTPGGLIPGKARPQPGAAPGSPMPFDVPDPPSLRSAGVIGVDEADLLDIDIDIEIDI
jgi:hypothetical protein